MNNHRATSLRTYVYFAKAGRDLRSSRIVRFILAPSSRLVATCSVVKSLPSAAKLPGMFSKNSNLAAVAGIATTIKFQGPACLASPVESIWD